MYKDITILTTSCKAYEDVLRIHELVFLRYFNNCPFERVLVMDESPDGGVSANYNKVIITGKKTGRENQRRINDALKQIDTPYIVFVQEDMLLQNTVDLSQWEYLLSVIKKHKAGVIYLNSIIRNKDMRVCFKGYTDIMMYPKGMPYRISYAPAIWNKEFLEAVSGRYIYGGDFERKGSEYSNRQKYLVLGNTKMAYPFINAITRGKWEVFAVQWLKNIGIDVDFTMHSMMDKEDTLKQAVLGYIYNSNPAFVLKLQNTFKMGKSY